MQVSSVTKVGSSLITIEYDWEQDMDEAFLELQKALGNFEQDDEIEEINISRLDPNAKPIILLAIRNDEIKDIEEIRRVAENYIRNEIIRLEGIADVKISGEIESEVEILTDEYLLDAYNVSPGVIAERLMNYNRNISGGSITEMGTKYIIKGTSLVKNIEDIRNIIITNRTDSNLTNNAVRIPVYLRDMAQVSFIPKKAENIVRLDQKQCLGLNIYKETKYNTIKVMELLDEELDKIRAALPGYEFTVVENQGLFIKSAIGEVQETALFGIILAVFILFVFLRRIGSTLIVSIAIPVSIIATFNLMYFNGLTLNIMTLGGLALGAGMLVDNAIVVLENIFRLRDLGKSVKEAAIEGTAQVGGAITASTLTTIIVFLPIVYLHGASGELFKDQAWTVAFSLLSSLFVAIVFIPVLFTKFYNRSKERKKAATIQFPGYKKFLEDVLSKKYMVVFFAALLIAVSIFLLPHIGSEYFPKAQSSGFTIELELPQGTRLERTASTTENVENIVREIAGEDIDILYSQIGPSVSSGEGSESFFQDENTSYILVKLKSEAIEKTDNYIRKINATLAGVTQFNYDILQEESSLQEILDTDEPPVIVEVKGENQNVLESLADQIIQKLNEFPYLYAVESSVQDGAPEIEIKIDRYRAGIYDVDVNSVVSTLQENLSGEEAGELDENGELKDIVVRYPEKNISDLKNIMIQAGSAKIPITEVATLTETRAPKEIIRRDQNRIVKVTAWLKEKKPLDHITNDLEETLKDIVLPAEYSINITGEEQKRKESFGNLSFALILSVILVYMVLASQFESLLHPFTILLTIPLAGVGSILLFFILGNSLNVMALIGIIMLAGIAVNDSIILVDAINQYKLEGCSVKESIVLAGQQRIRPILMTSLTTILALLPLTIGFGESVSLRAPMALAVIGGLVTSTLLTLGVIPCVYLIFEELRLKLVNNKND